MNYDLIYFLGIGGIGMSNLARYFISQGKSVAGYDLVETPLTKSLVAEGADIHYKDELSLIPSNFKEQDKTLIIYTPAIPDNHKEYNWFKNNGFNIMKRAEALGIITKSSDAICIAGTHGKTTVSSMVAHLLYESKIECNAFLGGILKNYGTNLLLTDSNNITVVEADEYDRSFHWLHPWIAVITSADPDHLDIYKTAEAYRESFEHFTTLIREDGHLLIRYDSKLTVKANPSVKVYTYSEDKGDFHAKNIRIGNGEVVFDYVSDNIVIEDISLGVPIRINIENAIAAITVALLNGVTPVEIKSAMKSFGGAERRFDFKLKTDKIVFIDDYAHHPQELLAAITSIKQLYPDKKITGIFQPHLYSRTRDFSNEFAKSLSHLDKIILLDIYPARELPIEGVSSKLIYDGITISDKVLINKEEVLNYLIDETLEVVVTFGAGDISKLLPDIERLLLDKFSISI